LRALAVILVVIAVVAGLVLLIRSRIVPTRYATVADIPAIVVRLATLKDGSFAVFMFTSPAAPGSEAVNLQYSVEHGTVGLDWVLLSATNIADKDRLAAFAAELGHPMTEHEMNKVRYLRTEGAGHDRLGTSIVLEFYGVPRTAQLELITEGFDWPPKS